jgi:hypothetical protein
MGFDTLPTFDQATAPCGPPRFPMP